MAYWDTSCLLKLYAAESDSASYQTHVVSGATLVTSEIARLEINAALQRKESLNDLQPGGARLALAAFDADVAQGLISVRRISASVVKKYEAIIEECYRKKPPLVLRTLDAIHLVTAADSAEVELVATDKRLRDAALSLGVSVYPAS